MFFIHEKEANSTLTKSGLKHLVAVTPSINNSTSNRSIQLDGAFGGRYKEHKRNGNECVKEISVKRVSNIDISISSLH